MPTTPLKLLSSMAPRELLTELSASYAQATGQTVAVEAAGGVDAVTRVQAGESVDIVVLADNAIHKLIDEGKLLSERIKLAKSGVAIAVRHGAVRPDIRSEEAVIQAVLAAPSLSYSTGPSGVHLERLFERWGILARIKPRIVVPPPGVPVGALVARGEAALGFQQLSELMNLPGIDVLGPLPDAIQSLTTFSGAVSAGSAQPDAARKALAFMAAPDTTPVKRKHGMNAA